MSISIPAALLAALTAVTVQVALLIVLLFGAGWVLSQVGATAARQMLLEAAVLDAPRMLQLGFLGHLVQDEQLEAHVQTTQQRIRALAPQAARLNKQTMRALIAAATTAGSPDCAGALAPLVAGAYDYADSAEHREGIEAFIAKRKPLF